MRLTNKDNSDSTLIKVKIREIREDTIICTHLASNYKVKAFIKKDMKLEIGQVVMLEYRQNGSVGGYIVVDDLMDEVEATVLEAQHIISDGTMYTSLILENPETKQRIHSLVPSTNKLFSSTNIIITGDKIKLRINNGNVFGIGEN